MDAAARGRTTFIIAHRLSTIADADLIVVMEKGRIVERGRFQDLIRQSGPFRDLAREGGLVPPATPPAPGGRLSESAGDATAV